MSLREYRKKRDFEQTSEPAGLERGSDTGRLYVIQKHAARRLHYDLRLELDGTLKSWAVPKGPSLAAGETRLAVHVEDHPVEYGSFEGIIPKGEYGGGTVMLWDQGEWEPVGDPRKGYQSGKLKFRIHGHKLRGTWTLVRMHGGEDKNWLLIKDKDESSVTGGKDVLHEKPFSVTSNRSMEEIAGAGERVWHIAPSPDPSLLPNARREEPITAIKPQLATPVELPPEGDRWLHEIKYDGYRILCVIADREVRLMSRNGKDWTGRFQAIAAAVRSLFLQEGVLDGEIVVVEPGGTTDFQALQNVLQGVEEGGSLVYYLFDILRCNGFDLLRTPLIRRKEFLAQLLKEVPDPLRYSDHILGRGSDVFENACRLSLEGVVSKRAESGYVQGRSRNWLKSKCLNRQEFVVGGYTNPSGSRTGFGALLVGYYDHEANLIFSGRVGTGFNEKTLIAVEEELKSLERQSSPFKNPPVGREARGVHWVDPRLVAEVEFTAWTDEGILRHPSFKGLRHDRRAGEVTLERPFPVSGGARKQGPPSPPSRKRPTVAGVPLTNPGRILYPAEGITKQDLARYYEEVAEWILPHLVGRPLTLLRCPEGHEGECFYQKHLEEALPKSLRGIPIREKEGIETYIVLDDLPGLISLVQLGVLELHPWQSREDALERPDRMIFDLDPGPEVQWNLLVRGAVLLRDRLLDLGLQSFVKTSGGKGLHVVVPLVRRSGWDEVKVFSKAVAEWIAREEPGGFVSKMAKSKRHGKVFIDYVRNSRGATAVAAYSTRARPGAPVSAPLFWEELSDHPPRFTAENMPRRLKSLNMDPWAKLPTTTQSITKGMKKRLSPG